MGFHEFYMALTYGDYLKVNELIQLQKPLSKGPEHDELLFITIHQAYELWFKQLLHELDHLCVLFREDERFRCLHTLKRVRTILKTLVQQVDILETMSPLEFSSFREFLDTASGFQSFQFREIEFLLGLKNPAKMKPYPEGSPERERLEKRLKAPAMWDVFLAFLSRRGFAVPLDVMQRDVTESIKPDTELQDLLIMIYRTEPLLSELMEAIVDIDEGLQEWRYRHVKMVERTIGMKPGTGGSSGAEYLRSTLFAPVYPDLWNIRYRL
ncbi:tryptophan 2,3-dioxygenase [Simiduia agarivorans]|uniref:tryptophan 2,3-dioxygenase n=1 Tax=Simiduia agarivorans TaxID=447471 RepID=UPI0023EA6956|nr:tryptophan 2,3-dioxygenase family protein [Simiduia agarivorans]